MEKYELIEKLNRLCGNEWVQLPNGKFSIPCPREHELKSPFNHPNVIYNLVIDWGQCDSCGLKTNIVNLLDALEAKFQRQTASQSGSVPNISKFDFTSIKDLLNEPEEEISWIVEGLLPSGGLSVMVAKPKVGKSTLVRQLALAVARGELFLGRKTVKGAVLYVSLEEKRSEVTKHFRLMGADGTEDLGVYVGSTPEGAIEWLRKEVERKKPVLVIIDTLFRFARVTDLNDYVKVNAALDPLLELARTCGAHLMALHHARKAAGDGADATLGSTATFGTVDTLINLKRTDARRTIDTIQRYGVDLETSVLNFEPETKKAFLGGTKEEDDTLKIETDIVEFLKTQNEPVTEKVIDDDVEGKTTLKRKALRDLFAKGKVARNGAGKKNDPYLYSCSLVPTIYIEQEKQDSNNPENPVNTDTNARSHASIPTDENNKPLPPL